MLNELCMNGWYVSFQGLVVISCQLTKRWNMGTGFEMARRLVGFFLVVKRITFCHDLWSVFALFAFRLIPLEMSSEHAETR